MSDDLIKQLREEGFEAEANRLDSVTPEEEQRFSEWLDVPENFERWVKALQNAKAPSE